MRLTALILGLVLLSGCKKDVTRDTDPLRSDQPHAANPTAGGAATPATSTPPVHGNASSTVGGSHSVHGWLVDGNCPDLRRLTTQADGLKQPVDFARCNVQAGTTSFALIADGRIITIDPAGNQMIRQRVREAKWLANRPADGRLHVEVTGARENDRLAATAIEVRQDR